jgi:cell division protein FtsL
MWVKGKNFMKYFKEERSERQEENLMEERASMGRRRIESFKKVLLMSVQIEVKIINVSSLFLFVSPYWVSIKIVMQRLWLLLMDKR